MFKFIIFSIFIFIVFGCTSRRSSVEIIKEDIEPSTEIYRNIFVEELLNTKNIEVIRINIDNNPISDFSFLKEFPQLRELSIHGHRYIRNRDINLDFLQYLNNLERLWLRVESIDGSLFNHLSNLQSLQLDGREMVNLDQIFKLPNLEHLFLNFYDDKIIVDNIMSESKLKTLHIFADEIDLLNIETLQYLTFLRLHTSNIINLSKLNNPWLENLILESFRFREFRQKLDLDGLQNLSQLRHFIVVYFDINDVSPLLNLLSLERVRFSDNNVNIIPLSESNTIKEIIVDEQHLEEINIELFTQNNIKISVYNFLDD